MLSKLDHHESQECPGWGNTSSTSSDELALRLWDKPVDQFTKTHHQLECIGSGGQAVVTLWVHNYNRRVVAIKERRHKKRRKWKTCFGEDVNKSPLPTTQVFERLRDCQEDLGILQIFSYEFWHETMYYFSTKMVLEYCNGGDLLNWKYKIKESKELAPELFIWHVYLEVAKALAFMHCGLYRKSSIQNQDWTPIIHRDVKPDNILLLQNSDDPNGFPLCKLADFDLSDFVHNGKSNNGNAGTPCWQPPEQWSDQDYPCATTAGDIWSLGAVILFLATDVISGSWHGSGLYGSTKRSELEKTCERKIIPIGDNYTAELDFCTRQALQRDPITRVDATRLVQQLQRCMPPVRWRNTDGYRLLQNPKSGEYERWMMCYREFEDWQLGASQSPVDT